jgi:4-hydroxybenzoyl-CoA thioesterase
VRTNMAALVNRRTFRIEWGQCDPAGIVFYPQFLVMFDAATGELFARTGFSAAEMRTHYGIIGMPLVEQGTKFLRPCRFDDEVTIESEAGDWGRASFVVRHRIINRTELAVEGFEKRVWAAADTEHAGRIKARAIPAEVIACLSDPTGVTLCRDRR